VAFVLSGNCREQCVKQRIAGHCRPQPATRQPSRGRLHGTIRAGWIRTNFNRERSIRPLHHRQTCIQGNQRRGVFFHEEILAFTTWNSKLSFLKRFGVSA
jgi:hypothetical protein